MKKCFLLFFLISKISLSQNNELFDYRYDFSGEKLITAFSKSNGILYKSNNNISFKKRTNWYKYKNNETYFFSEHHEDSVSFTSIDFYIVNKHFISDKFYLQNSIKQFKAAFGGINFEKNYIVNYSSKNKKYDITEIFYEIKADKFIRLAITSNKILDKNYITDKKLFIGFSNFIKEFKESPGKVIDVLDVYFEKDYSAQIDLIKQIDLEAYNTNSLYGSVLVDLHTNEGSFDKIKNNISKRKKRDLKLNTKILNIDKFLNEHTNNCDIVMLNEYHSYPHTRFNLMYALKNLKSKEYEYLALETLHPKFVTDSLVVDFNKLEGYYLEEPTCALLVAYANSLGFKLVAYDEDLQCDTLSGINRRNCRDSIQAHNIKRIFDGNENAKLVVIAGHSHIEKKIRDDWKFMRVVIDHLFPMKKIISIDQDKYIRTNLEIKDLNFNKPVVFLSEDEQFDAYMISPFYENYYEWYYSENEIMNTKIPFDLKNKNIYFIEVVSKENTKLSIFKSKVKNLLKEYIFLPDTIKYEIIYKDINNKKM